MLITRPNHDITTNYLYYWSQPLIDCARKHKHSVIDLSKKRANTKELTSVIQKIHPSCIVLNGHGNGSTVTGYDNEPLITAGTNSLILKSAVVYARSCQSAKELGPESIHDGCKAYIGYDDDFVFMVEEEKISRPLADKTARLFLDASNQVVISLLKGHTAKESNRRSKEKYKRTIQSLMTSDAKKEDNELIPLLIWDYSHQVCLGDSESII